MIKFFRIFLVFYLVTLYLFIEGEGKTYYFSSTLGSDYHTSTQAQNLNSPWKSLAKANEFFSKLTPGDSILFKAGDKFKGYLYLKKSGTDEWPIYIGHYGEGASPIISGFQTVDNWKPVGEGVYKASTKKILSRLNLVTKNSIIQPLGRFPNRDEVQQGYITLKNPSKNNQIYHSILNKGINWTGAEAVFRKNQWIIDRDKIVAHRGDTITFIPSSTYSPKEEYGFFIQNHLKTLDNDGEWFFDQEAKELYMYFGELNPQSSEVSYGLENELITSLPNIKNIIIEGLHLEGANQYSIHILGGSNIKIISCKILYSGIDGLLVTNVSNFSIKYSTIKHSLNSGINLKSGNEKCILNNNTIDSTYLFSGMGQDGNNNGFAIFSASSDDLIERNQIYNSGYVGIRFRGDRTIVRENLIDGFCISKNDGAGIYSYTGNSNTTFVDRVVERNIIINGKGNPYGTPLKPGIQALPVEGIYLDDNASGIKVKNNTVAHIKGKGIYIHNARDILIENNLIFDAAYCLYLKSDDLGQDVTGIQVIGNQFIAYTPQQYTIGIDNLTEDIQSMATWQKNKHKRPLGDDNIIYLKTKSNIIPENLGKISHTKWVKDWGLETESIVTTSLKPYYTIQNYTSPNLFENMRFEKSIKGVSGKYAAWKSGGLFNTGHIRVDQEKNDSNYIKLDIGKLEKNTQYVVEFQSKATSNAFLQAFLRYSGPPYYLVSTEVKTSINTSMGKNHMVFEVVEDVQNGCLIMEIIGEDISFGIDNLVIKQARVNLVKISEFFNFIYNYSQNPLLITNEYLSKKNILNTTIEGKTIPPYSSILHF